MDLAVQYLRRKPTLQEIETGWDRFEKMQDQCGFGELGLCCRNCLMGPCRINPFGESPTRGICGITADGIVARNLCRTIAVGAAAHSDHGIHIFEVLEKISQGVKLKYSIKSPQKFEQLLKKFNLNLDFEKGLVELLKLAHKAFTSLEGAMFWLEKTLTAKRFAKLKELNVIPIGVDPTIRETLHRTHMGTDADYKNLLLGAIKCSLADFLGMDIASNLSDVLLGIPKLKFSISNLGVINAKAVNIAVHGHNPLVSTSILEMTPFFHEKAKEAGAEDGVNIVGICCTGTELLLRNGIPLATNSASQEIAVLTGALDAMVVDVQCIMPSLADVCECFHTKLITTMSIAKIPGAMHVEFEPETAEETASKIIETAIEAYKSRNRKLVDIPNICQETMVGFSPEAIFELLLKINEKEPLKPFIDNVVLGKIFGIVLFAGCNNYKVVQDYNFINMAKELARHNILLVATGCAGGAFGKCGFLSPSALHICGEKLQEVLIELGKYTGFNRPLPPVWHMGSCVDNSRVIRILSAIAETLEVDISDLPVAASAPELMSEKSIAIGTYAVSLGVTTHIGVTPQVLGGREVTEVLTNKITEILDAKFIIETDPFIASQKIIEHISNKRKKLGI